MGKWYVVRGAGAGAGEGKRRHCQREYELVVLKSLKDVGRFRKMYRITG